MFPFNMDLERSLFYAFSSKIPSFVMMYQTRETIVNRSSSSEGRTKASQLSCHSL